MGKTGFAIIVIIGVLFFASQSAAQRQQQLADAQDVPPPTLTTTAAATPSPIPTEPTKNNNPSTQGSEMPTDLTVEPLTATQVALPATQPPETVPATETPTAMPELTPTQTPVPPSSLIQAPIAQSSLRSRYCAQPDKVQWTRQFTVSKTMNRWQVWQQEVGQGTMRWERFVYEVESVNQVLWHDWHMFKVNKIYLLPECADMEE